VVSFLDHSVFCLFVVCVTKLSVTHTIGHVASNDWMIVAHELERMWKEADVVRNLPSGTGNP
jgi:hypothetical protein